MRRWKVRDGDWLKKCKYLKKKMNVKKIIGKLKRKNDNDVNTDMA